MSAKLVPTFADRGVCVVSVTAVNLDFLDPLLINRYVNLILDSVRLLTYVYIHIYIYIYIYIDHTSRKLGALFKDTRLKHSAGNDVIVGAGIA
jgi:hypothetical protein